MNARIRSPLPTRLLLLLVLSSVLLVSLSACDRLKAGADEGDDDATATAQSEGEVTPDPTPVVNRDVERTVTADGRLVQPRPDLPLTFSVSGTLDELFVREGSTVDAGDTIATVETSVLDLAIADARAGLASAEASLGKLSTGASVETSRLEVERAKNSLWGSQAQRDSICGAFERGFADEASCDNAQAAVQAGEQGVQIAQRNLRQLEETIDGDIASARANVTRSRMSLADAVANREKAVLTAPVAGTITIVNAVPGVPVSPGAPVVTLSPSGSLQFVTSNLSERYVGNVRKGAPAEVLLTAYPDYPLDAVVNRIAPQGTEDVSGAVVYTVYLDVGQTDLPVLAGMTGRVEIESQ